MRGPPNLNLTTHNSKAKVIWKSFELNTNSSQACLNIKENQSHYFILQMADDLQGGAEQDQEDQAELEVEREAWLILG